VGMTRARRHLTLSWARERSVFGGRYERGLPSRFLAEIPEELVEEVATGAATGWAGAGSYKGSASTWDRPTAGSFGGAGRFGTSATATGGRGPIRRRDPGLAPALRIGDDVEHASFGDGVVTG